MNAAAGEGAVPPPVRFPPPAADRRRPLRRRAFALYAALVFTATHWPKLEIHAPIERPDLVIHLGVFGLWAGACIAAAFFGPLWSTRNILISGLVSLIYSAFDEATQAIPFIHRTCALDDWCYNALGVAGATAIALLLARRRRARAGSPGVPIF